MSEWSQIETAPKDGTEFIAFCEDGDYWLIRWCPNDKEEHWPAEWHRQRGAFCAGLDVGECVVIPCLTHWMPLPSPPVTD